MSIASRIRGLGWVTPEQFSISQRKTRAVIRQCADQLEATMTAGQDAAVAAGVDAALADFNSQLDAVATRFEGLDAETPAVDAPPADPAV